MRAALAFACLFAWLALSGWGAPPAQAAPDAVRWVPPGWFVMGSRPEDVDYARRLCVQERLPRALRLRGCADEALFANELGARRVHLSAFGIDRYELTRAQYHACVVEGACTPEHLSGSRVGVTSPDRPIGSLTWSQARDACAHRGGRLPSEAEWERAARGVTHRRFPWGMQFDGALANHGGPAMSIDPLLGRPSDGDGYLRAAPVGRFGTGVSPVGALDMAGNVWEWTADGYAPLSELKETVDPTGAGQTGLRVVRGGSWRSPAFTLRVTHRGVRPEGGQWADVGVRCAYDAR